MYSFQRLRPQVVSILRFFQLSKRLQETFILLCHFRSDCVSTTDDIQKILDIYSVIHRPSILDRTIFDT